VGGLAAAVFAIAVVRMNAPDGAQITVAGVQGSDVTAETGAAIVAQMREAAPALASQQGLVASPLRQSSLSPHLTLAALGIPGENSPEVGVVSRWSYPLDDLTEQEVQRAVAWARHANNTEWNMAGSPQGLSRFSSAGATEGFQAGQVSFTPNR
jgi:hypothetical protein